MDLRDRIERHLAGHVAGARVTSLTPLAGGACQDLFAVDVNLGGRYERWVLRSDAARGLPGSISRAREYAVVRAAAEAGVPTPMARWFGEDLVRDGAGAYFLEWREGTALGGKVVRAPELARAREVLPDQLAQALAAIHRIRPDTHPLDLDGPEPGEAAGRWALRRLRSSLDRLGAPRPDLEYAMAWLADNVPDEGPPVLVHGDFRTGNFLVGPHGLTAVLDWEFAHWGSPAEDIGWLCVRDWRFGAIDKPAGGLCRRERFLEAYRAAGGVDVTPQAVHFWEVFGNVSWASGALYQTQRFMEGDHDFELLAIGRRAGEMAWEALRLVERGAA